MSERPQGLGPIGVAGGEVERLPGPVLQPVGEGHVRNRLIRLSDGMHALDHRLAGLLTAAAHLAGRRWM